MKIIHVVGARPNFIKVKPLMNEMSNRFEQILVHTGQHYDQNMSDNFFRDLEIPEPDYNLGIGSGSHAEQTAKIIIEFEKVCLKEKPGLIIVYGDVNSTIACALVAVKLNIKVAHIEAGMRSFDRKMPEEINRILTDHISSVNFCSSEIALQNLRKEGIDNGIVVGDLMYDAFLDFSKLAVNSDILKKLNLVPKNYLLMTMHRAGNTDNKAVLEKAVKTLCSLDEKIVFPMHPRTKKMLIQFGLFAELSKTVMVINPVGYLDMVQLLKNSKLLLTDSGGMQKEAYFAKVPCITLRDTTEWIETLNEGNVLLGNDFDMLRELVEKQLNTKFNFKKEFYGDGKSAKKITEELTNEHSD